ncbi:MAG: nucleotidyltransferase domain-containing protein [Acholeplasmatales bacterium]|jgi:predicted nucleotidyltransferase|nr:nucleotidyltransferase domain-containing protein [Acholeplasmatales bacterium]
MKTFYNPKLDYQFCKNLIIGNTDEFETRLKMVYFNKEKSTTITENKILVLKKALNYLKTNITKNIGDTLTTTYKLIFNMDIEKEKMLKILKICSCMDENKIYQLLIEEDIFDTDIIFACFIYNAIRIIKMKHIIIFYNATTKLLNVYYKIRNTAAALQILNIMKKQTKVQNIKHPLFNKEYVVQTIIKNKDTLLNEYYVIELYLVGSASRDTMDCYSDVDVICIVRKKDIESKYSNIKVTLLEYLKEIFDMHVDLKIGGKINDLNLNDNFKRDLFRVF